MRGSGRVYEALAATRRHRERLDLYHSALIVQSGRAHAYAIEMAPVWAVRDLDRGVISEGPVGSRSWGRYRLFRYEIRCWRDGTIPDAAAAVDSPDASAPTRPGPAECSSSCRPSPSLPGAATSSHRRDVELQLADRLAARPKRPRHRAARFQPPVGGRAPGWSAGLVVAARAEADSLMMAGNRGPRHHPHTALTVRLTSSRPSGSASIRRESAPSKSEALLRGRTGNSTAMGREAGTRALLEWREGCSSAWARSSCLERLGIAECWELAFGCLNAEVNLAERCLLRGLVTSSCEGAICD